MVYKSKATKIGRENFRGLSKIRENREVLYRVTFVVYGIMWLYIVTLQLAVTVVQFLKGCGATLQPYHCIAPVTTLL